MRASWVTVEYPDSARQYYPRYRGAHRLLLKNNGDVRCTACFLCSTACPAKCINIEPQEGEGSTAAGAGHTGNSHHTGTEKFPKRFEINTLRCIYCGLCVQACPVDAIRMDTGVHPEIYASDPNAFIETKDTLMQRSKDVQAYGVDGVKSRRTNVIREIEIR